MRIKSDHHSSLRTTGCRRRTTAYAAGGVLLLLTIAGCVATPTNVTPGIAAVPTGINTTIPTGPAPGTTPVVTVDAADGRTWSSTSPDGRWIAEGSMEGPFMEGDQEKYRVHLVVRRVDGQATWSVVDQVSNYGLGYTVPVPFHWSTDGQSLYVTNAPVPDGCALFVNGSDLQRVDLTSGTVTEVVPAVGSSLALSPDETHLAYVGWGADTVLVVRSLDGADVARVPLAVGPDSAQAGNIVWSPDGQSVLVTIAYNPCVTDQWTQSIVRVDLAPVLQNILVDRDERLLETVSWSEPARAHLRDGAGKDYWLDTRTGGMSPVP